MRELGSYRWRWFTTTVSAQATATLDWASDRVSVGGAFESVQALTGLRSGARYHLVGWFPCVNGSGALLKLTVSVPGVAIPPARALNAVQCGNRLLPIGVDLPEQWDGRMDVVASASAVGLGAIGVVVARVLSPRVGGALLKVSR